MFINVMLIRKECTSVLYGLTMEQPNAPRKQLVIDAAWRAMMDMMIPLEILKIQKNPFRKSSFKTPRKV